MIIVIIQGCICWFKKDGGYLNDVLQITNQIFAFHALRSQISIQSLLRTYNVYAF